MPSRTFNTTVSHTRQILGTTFGHPATWNDKTIILYDEMVRKVNDGQLYDKHNFKLMEKKDDGEIVEVEYKGVWFMVDNGYLAWSCTVPPIKNGITYDEIRFSQWLESMRKDVECTFGILKGRFCILRYGIRLQSIEKCDQVYLTCCALHNRLLFVDGLHKDWKEGRKSDWEISYEREEPSALYRLNHVPGIGDTETIFAGSEMNNICYEKYEVDRKRIVSKMPLNLFQNRLVHHFNIRFEKQSIKWPVRLKTPTVY